MRKQHLGYFVCIFAILACRLASVGSTATPTLPTSTPTLEFTSTPLNTLTPAITFTPTITLTPTITSTPTSTFPTVTVNKQAHCRYGPSVAYLHAADLYPGDTGAVTGRFEYSGWLHVKFDKLKYFCWVAPSVVDIKGDITALPYTEPNLQTVGTSQYKPPQNITAVRDGDEVTINWSQVAMTTDKDRGYLIIAFVCQNGAYLWWTYSFPDQFTTTYTVKDEAGCPVPSEGVIYTVNKEGFSKPGQIPWPAP